jgi:hypothetical protein
VDWQALAEIAGDGPMQTTLQRISMLLLGTRLPVERVAAVERALGQVPEDARIQTAVAVLLGSPQYQWR